MKKYILVLGLAAFAAASCSIDENKLAQPETDGPRLVLSGETTMNTKVSVGEKDGDIYPLLWVTGDVIRISTKGVAAATEEAPAPEGTFSNEAAELFSESSGSASGVFQTTNSLVAASDMDIVITYPGTAVYSEGVLTSSVPALQTQRSANSSLHVGNYALAYDNDVTLAAGQTEDVTFQLQQKTAFVKLVLSTSEYTSYNLTGASLYAADAELAGDVSCNLETGELTVTDPSETVGAEISRPSVFSGSQEVYFTALPCDLTSNDQVYVIVTMKNPNGNETVTIPVKVNGGLLKESCLSVIEVSGISEESIPAEYKWYDPVETRDLVDGWAYGKQNTYLIEQKAAGEGETSLSIDVRARGDFSKVKEPKYYGLLTGSSEMYNNNDGSGRKLLHLPNNVLAYEPTPTNTVNSDYTIDVYCYDQSQTGRWGVVALYDKDYNIIWSFMIWKYFAGDDPRGQDVTYHEGNIVLMDRLLGATYGNTMAEEKGTFEIGVAYFQWGRKDPFMWSNSSNGVQINSYNERTTPVGSDISTAIASPNLIHAYGGEANDNGDWQEKEHRTDLWGGVNNTTEWYDPSSTGYKTIYDPCPEGYRVPDTYVAYLVKNNAERWEIPNGVKYGQEEGVLNEDSPFYPSGASVLAYPLGNGTYDYWPFAGAHWAGAGANWGNRPSSNNRHAALYWFNNVLPTDARSAVCLQYCYYSASYSDTNTTATRARTFAVRCQKDTENR